MQPHLQVKDLSVYFHKSRTKSFPIVENISFDLCKGETTAIIGESGSGKSVTALSLLRLLPSSQFTTSGQVLFQEQDLLQAPPHFLHMIRGKKIAMIFQNPQASLNPVATIEQHFQELIETHLFLPEKQHEDVIIQSLARVGFHHPHTCLKLYPHELSGGMLQRVCIALALLASPDILIADEPTTALDVSVQLQILRLLKQLQSQTGMSLLIITHDMGVVAEMADNVLVMYSGKIVEHASVLQLFDTPNHPYTQDLLASRPTVQCASGAPFITIPGQPPHYSNRPEGCFYHPRCKRAQKQCLETAPKEKRISKEQKVRCWLYE